MGKSTKIVTCRYKNCLHEDKVINKEEAIKSGTMYYHPDCFKAKEEIKQIVELFTTHINPNPVFSQLHSTINNIVFTRKIGSDFLLFGLKYYIEHKIPLNYPQGLYYVIQNKDVANAYNKIKVTEMKKKMLENPPKVKEEAESDFTYKPAKQKGFADILG